MKIQNLFERGNAGLGWAALWRLALILVPLNFLAKLAAMEASANPAGAVAMLLALPVGGNVYLVPIAIPVVLFAWNWIGKYVMEKKLGARPNRFVGWSLYWRVALLQLAGIFALTLVFLPMTFLAQKAGDRTQMVILAIAGLVLLPALIYWSLNVAGFALRRVAAFAPADETAQTETAEGGPALVRSYQALFDRSRYGMNWMLAAVYPVTGLVGMFTWPLVDALFGEQFSFAFGDVLPIFLLTWIIGGVALALFLHYLRAGWQVVAAFTLLLLATRFLQSALLGLLPDGAGMSALDPQGLVSRAAFAALYATGLIAGIRFIGPTILGFGIGVAVAGLVHLQLVFPISVSIFSEAMLSDLWQPRRFGMNLVSALIDVGVSGAAYWWACDWHLRQRGLQLTQQGMIRARGPDNTPD